MKRILFVFVVVVLMSLGRLSLVRAAEPPSQVTGEVIDTYCYALMGAKGESHRQCALECVKKGIPVGLLEAGTNTVYVLLPNKEATSLPDALIDKLGRSATVTGHKYASGGSQFLTVESVS